MPYIITGLKQGWAFAWRSLFAGEMLSLSLAWPAAQRRTRQQ